MQVIPVAKTHSFSSRHPVGLLADAEVYVSLGDEVEERYASKLRGRIGLGYRFNAQRRIDFLYILDRTQNTIEDTPHSTTQAFDPRYKAPTR